MRAAIYLRVSTEEQAEQNLSIPAQENRIVAYCQSRDWIISERYIDDGYSGKDLNRPAMQRVIDDCRAGKFDVLVVWKLDRLSRKLKDALYIIEEVLGLDDNTAAVRQIDLASVTEHLDTSTSIGRLMLTLVFAIAQLERETIIERTRMGKKEAARQGRFGGGVPFGYDYDKAARRLVINPIQAEAVKMIYDLYLTGQYGFKRIADIMTERGFCSQGTAKMTKEQVVKTLSSPAVAGLVKHLCDTYPGQHEAIILLDQWQQAQKLQQDRYTPIPVRDEINLLTGLIWCGKCGARLRFKSREWKSAHSAGRNYYYICYGRAGFKSMAPEYCRSPFHHAEAINEQVVQKLREYAFSVDEIRQEVDLQYAPPDNKGSIAAIKKELSAIDARMERWATAFETGAMSAELVSARIKTLADRKNALQGTLHAFEQQADNVINQREMAEGILQVLRDLPDNWAAFTPEEKRGLIFSLVKKITVHEDGSVAVELDL